MRMPPQFLLPTHFMKRSDLADLLRKETKQLLSRIAMEIQTQTEHLLLLTQAPRHHTPRDVTDPGAQVIQLLPPSWNFSWSPSHFYMIQHGLAKALVILHLCASLPFSVSAGNTRKSTEMPYEVLLFCFVFSFFLFWREIENSRNLLSEPVFIRFLAQVFGESSNFFFLN